MTKMYAVSQGDYSDRRVEAIFSSEEKANTFMDTFGGRDHFNAIESYDLDPYELEIKEGYSFFRVTMAKDGEVLDVKSLDRGRIPDTSESWVHWHQPNMINPEYDPLFHDWPKQNRVKWEDRVHKFIKDPNRKEEHDFIIMARDRQHAIKIANEQRVASILKADNTAGALGE